jgi:hypothetical protein
MGGNSNDDLVSPASTLDAAPLLEQAFQRRANPQAGDSAFTAGVAPTVPSGFDMPNEPRQLAPRPPLKGP